METPDYNPNSLDAQFAKIFAHLEAQSTKFEEKRREDKEAFTAIMAKQDKTNGRVNVIETWISVAKGKVAMLATGVSVAITIVGWLVTHYWK